ncbi:hypothetical protein N9105_03890 [Akkermansiaceae bacterium]|nr:hypothetical protein [Akkermansiaceae bacterium]
MKAAGHSKALVLLPLVVGVALSFALPHLKPLAQLEHALFWIPSQSEKSDLLIEREPLTDFRITVSDVSPSENLAKETSRVLTSSGEESVTDWLFALNAVRTHGAEKVTLSPLLSWDEADELELRTLDHEIASFPAAALGITLRLESVAQPFPTYLEKSIIPAANFHGRISSLPEINAISGTPSTSTGLLGFRILENAQPQIKGDDISIPFLARWDERIFPSLELASLIVSSGNQPSDVTISSNGQLRIGKTGPVFSLDHRGYFTIPSKHPPEAAALKTLLDPSAQDSPKKVTFLGPSDPLHLQQSSQILDHLSSRVPRNPTVFHRLPFWIEIPILILLSLLLQVRKPLALILLALPAVLAQGQQQWLVLTPALALALTYLILKSRFKKSVPESKKTAQPKAKKRPKEIKQESKVKPESIPEPETEPEIAPTPTPKPSPKTKPSKKAAKKAPKKKTTARRKKKKAP